MLREKSIIDIILKDMKYRKTRGALTVCGSAVIIMLLAWRRSGEKYVMHCKN
jgi:hypothetical protein